MSVRLTLVVSSVPVPHTTLQSGEKTTVAEAVASLRTQLEADRDGATTQASNVQSVLDGF